MASRDLHQTSESAESTRHLAFTIDEGLEFLNKDNEITKKVLEAEVEAKEKMVATIRSLITVGAFIAGVQAQVITFTFANNNTNLQAITNGFGFVGLALDVLGTSFGMLHAVALQRSILRINQLMRSRETQEFNHSYSREEVEKELTVRKKFWMIRRHLLDSDPTFKKSFGDHPSRLFLDEQFKPLQRLAHYIGVEHILGVDPTLAMGAGIMCLLMSVILFAAYSQQRSVWLACVSITAIVVLTTGCSILIHNELEGNGIMHVLDTAVDVTC